MIDQVVEWGFAIGKIELKIMVKDLLNNKGISLFIYIHVLLKTLKIFEF